MAHKTMSTIQKVVKLFYNKSGQVDPDQVNLACSFLNKKGVIALPTDTLYGIAARADDSSALERIYRIKDRDKSKPLAICIPTVEQIEDVADIGKISKNIFRSLLPGPITVVLKRAQKLNKDLNPNIETIGVRIPDHNFVLAISHIVGPLALTSANRSGSESSLCVDDFRDIWDDLDCVFDLGPLRSQVIKNQDVSKLQRLGSTVVDLSNQEKRIYTIIREGCASNRTINILNRFGYVRKH